MGQQQTKCTQYYWPSIQPLNMVSPPPSPLPEKNLIRLPNLGVDITYVKVVAFWPSKIEGIHHGTLFTHTLLPKCKKRMKKVKIYFLDESNRRTWGKNAIISDDFKGCEKATSKLFFN